MSSFVSPLFQKRKAVEESSISSSTSAKRLRHVEEKATSNNNAPQTKYDVFVSFRGEIRNGFISHLIEAFERDHINAFVDDRLEKGKEVGSSLDGAIKESAISLIIFSKKYAYSRWCLNELVTILKCSDENGQTVIPVFYKVKPTHVRHQSSKSYKKAFVKHQENNETNIQIWRDALERAANISGIESSSWKKDAELVKEIVRIMLEKKSVKPIVNTKGMGGLGNERDRSNKAMSSTMNTIMEITDKKETWKIPVRLINMWTIPSSQRFTIEMILMDNQGNKILAQRKNVDLELWKEILKVGSTYVIQNFEVENNTGQYKATNHAYKIKFVKATKIKPHDFPDIPLTGFKFTRFDSILDGSACPDFLIDVIGVVEVVQWDLDGKRKKVMLTMTNECGTKITCTLWESLAMQLKNYLDNHVNRPVVVLLNMAKIKEARGNYPIFIQNSMYGSKLFINDSVKEIEEFKNRLHPSGLSMIRCSQKSSQVSYCSQFFAKDCFLRNAHVKSLMELRQLKTECTCVTVATITKLLVANGWVYEGCPKCNKKVDEEEIPYTCQGCGNESSSTLVKFRLDVKVAQLNETAIFTLWDRECYALIKETASDIKKHIIDEEGEFDPKNIPKVLDRILGKKLALRFKALPNNTRYSVCQICEDEDVIASILEKLSLNEVEIAQVDTKRSMSSIQKFNDVIDSQCLFATGESDPNLSKSVTLAKRSLVPTHKQLEGTPFEDLSNIKLSCSQLSKHVKSG